jgi:hypothetical protein
LASRSAAVASSTVWAQLCPNGAFSVAGGVDEAAPVYDPADRQPAFDLAETAIEFELLVPGVRSDIVCQPGALASNAAFQPARAVLNALAGPTSSPTTDYPSTGLVLDLILDALSLRARRHHPAFARQSTLVPHSPRTTASRSLK